MGKPTAPPLKTDLQNLFSPALNHFLLVSSSARLNPFTSAPFWTIHCVLLSPWALHKPSFTLLLSLPAGLSSRDSVVAIAWGLYSWSFPCQSVLHLISSIHLLNNWVWFYSPMRLSAEAPRQLQDSVVPTIRVYFCAVIALVTRYILWLPLHSFNTCLAVDRGRGWVHTDWMIWCGCPNYSSPLDIRVGYSQSQWWIFGHTYMSKLEAEGAQPRWTQMSTMACVMLHSKFIKSMST